METLCPVVVHQGAEKKKVAEFLDPLSLSSVLFFSLFFPVLSSERFCRFGW